MEQADVEAWYRRYGPMVYRRCLALLRDEAQAEEAMQDVFVNVWKQAERVIDMAPSSYLYQAATRVSLNIMRTRGRRPDVAEYDVADVIAEQTSAEKLSSTRQALARLFRKQKIGTDVIAVLHYVDGMTLDEVAHEVGLSASGVRKRLKELDMHFQQLQAGEVL